jgi:hypothetical protein
MQLTLDNTCKNRKYTKMSYVQCGRFLSKEETETGKFAGNVLNKVQLPVWLSLAHS